MDEGTFDNLHDREFQIFCPDNGFMGPEQNEGARNFMVISPCSRYLSLNCYHKTQGQMNMIDLDTFFQNSDCWEKKESFCHAEAIKHFNFYKRINFFTSYILNTLAHRYEKIVGRRCGAEHPANETICMADARIISNANWNKTDFVRENAIESVGEVIVEEYKQKDEYDR